MNPYAWLGLSLASLIASMTGASWVSRAVEAHRPIALFVTILLILVTLTLFIGALVLFLDWSPPWNRPYGIEF